MAPHSSTLAWKIPWMEEPCRLQSIGSQRVGHNWSDLAIGSFIFPVSSWYTCSWLCASIYPALHEVCVLGKMPKSSAPGGLVLICLSSHLGFSDGSVVKNLPANAGDIGSIPGLGSSPGEGNGSPLQYSCLENPMDRGSWWATIPGVTKSLDTS